jgi:serine protease Do
MKRVSVRSGSRAWAGAALIVLALLVSACGGTSSADQGNSATTGSATSAPVAQAAATAAPAATAATAPTPADQPPAGSSAASTDSAAAGDFAAAVRNVAQKVKPAVVQITNEQVQVGQLGQATVPAGVGSGVIYDNQGHIITNDHVIAGAQGLTVSLPDGRTFRAKVLGSDPSTDLAVIQISGNNLPVAQLGDSHQLQVGDWVVAIGNALGLTGGPTVTAGVVSALGRSVQEPGDQNGPGPFLFDVIQTSAPINPGNSGGALVDLSGRVIGINTLVAGQAEPGVQAQGIGFAISISTAKPLADQLVATGKVVHPSMGIQYVPLNPAIAAQVGVDQPYGALVMDVVAGSGAAKAGLQQSDVIVAIDGQQLKEESALAQMISSHKPGDKVTLTVLRNNKQQNVDLTLGQAQ